MLVLSPSVGVVYVRLEGDVVSTSTLTDTVWLKLFAKSNAWTVKVLVPSVGEDFIVQEPVYREPEERVRETLAVQTLPRFTVAFLIPDVASVRVARRVTTSLTFAFV